MNNKTLFLDFDGVLRIWSSTKISTAEKKCGVEKGTVLETAFSTPFLHRAVTGKINHTEWLRLVRTNLLEKYGGEIAECLVAAWNAEDWEIDEVLLNELIRVAPNYQLVLVTNATDRLTADLIKSGLENTFSHVVNSSEIGFAKPELAFFDHALTMSNTYAEDSIFVDDSLSHISAARKLGIESVLHENRSDTLSFVKSKCT